MRDIKKHIPKSNAHREYYVKVLKNLDYEPTVDDTLKFPETDDKDKDYSLPTTEKRRRLPFKTQIREHFEENWIKYVVGIISAVLFFLMVESKIDISVIKEKINNLREDIIEVKSLTKENRNKLDNQEKEILENKYKIKYLENTKEK